jgi:hypothetical protein
MRGLGCLPATAFQQLTYPDGSKDGLRIRRAPAKPLVSSSSNGCDLLRLNQSRTLNGPEGNSQKKLPFWPLQIMRATSGPWMGHRKRPTSALTTGSSARLARQDMRKGQLEIT